MSRASELLASMPKTEANRMDRCVLAAIVSRENLPFVSSKLGNFKIASQHHLTAGDRKKIQNLVDNRADNGKYRFGKSSKRYELKWTSENQAVVTLIAIYNGKTDSIAVMITI